MAKKLLKALAIAILAVLLQAVLFRWGVTAADAQLLSLVAVIVAVGLLAAAYFRLRRRR